MRIICIKCDSTYSVNESKIPDKGATFTCKKCQNRIFVDKNMNAANNLKPLSKNGLSEKNAHFKQNVNKIFISYHRQSKPKINLLTSDINSIGYEVWFDDKLGGGQKWWNTILKSIQESDIFVFAITKKSLESLPCKLELNYANNLLKPILPVLIDDEDVSIDLLPPLLSQIQFIDYQNQNHEAAIALARALLSVPPPKPLPSPLPEPPDVPISYLGTIAMQVETDSQLSYEEQSSLLLNIKKYLSESPSQETVVLLNKFRERKDLFAVIADEIDELLFVKEKQSILNIVKHNKLNAFLFFLILSSFIAATYIYNYNNFKQDMNISCEPPEWFFNTPDPVDALFGVGVSRAQNIEESQRAADNFARQNILQTISLNSKDYLENDNIIKQPNGSISIRGCKITKRKMCSDGRVFSLAYFPLYEMEIFKPKPSKTQVELNTKKAFDAFQKELDSLNKE